jgi:hypothetical protein
MNNIIIALIGAGAGLLVAVFGNIIALPWVLRQQATRLPSDYRSPIFGWDKQKIASITRLVYRYQMPLLWAFFGAVFAVQIFGSSK